jgi:hypothetical protein
MHTEWCNVFATHIHERLRHTRFGTVTCIWSEAVVLLPTQQVWHKDKTFDNTMDTRLVKTTDCVLQPHGHHTVSDTRDRHGKDERGLWCQVIDTELRTLRWRDSVTCANTKDETSNTLLWSELIDRYLALQERLRDSVVGCKSPVEPDNVAYERHHDHRRNVQQHDPYLRKQ